MEFSVLGPVAVRLDGREISLGGAKQRAVLAILLLDANHAVSRDRLIDGLWGERPPATAAHTLDSYVSRLRRMLGDGRVERRPPGYVLRVDQGELDLDEFEALLAEGRAQLAQGAAGDAAQVLRAAIALWRGPALADVLYEPFAQREADRLEERRLIAIETRIDADLDLGEEPSSSPSSKRSSTSILNGSGFWASSWSPSTGRVGRARRSPLSTRLGSDSRRSSGSSWEAGFTSCTE
jgi:DNA-binding SARP family transcriptional activator